MAYNDNLQPLLVAGQLPKKCYKDMQEFVNDLAKVLQFPLDAVAVIKGAQGEKGVKGDKGGKGDQGDDGQGVTPHVIVVPIPNSATYVEFNKFTGWESAIYSIRTQAQLNSADISIPDYDPADGIVGVGTIVQVFAVPSPTKIRCYFVFAGGITATPNNEHVLNITYYTT